MKSFLKILFLLGLMFGSEIFAAEVAGESSGLQWRVGIITGSLSAAFMALAVAMMVRYRDNTLCRLWFLSSVLAFGTFVASIFTNDMAYIATSGNVIFVIVISFLTSAMLTLVFDILTNVFSHDFYRKPRSFYIVASLYITAMTVVLFMVW